MTDLRTPPKRTLPPELDDEDEVDLGRYWRAVVARWWLLLAGLVVGLVLGYLVSLGSGSVWQASAVVYLGTPLSVGGGSVLQGLQQNPRTVNTIIHSEAAIQSAARQCGLRPDQLRGNVSSKAVSGGGRAAARSAVGQFQQVTVKAGGPRRAACPANALARQVITQTSGFVDTKVSSYRETLASLKDSLDSINNRIRILTGLVSQAGTEPTFEDLFLVSQLDSAIQRRQQLIDQKASNDQLLALAENIEKPQLFEPAAARKTTARSPRNAMLVGGVLGLLVGAILALVWDRLPRSSAWRDA
jgi:hypothetical protein